jgi:chromosome segregation ATPase
MKDDMEKNLEDAKSGETVASAGFADLKSAKDAEVELASESIEAKEKKTGALAVSIAQSQDALEDTTEDQTDSQTMLKTLLTTCDSKKLEWQARLKSRTDEISAISEAVTILNDDDALDVFKKAVPAALVEQASGFLQTQHSEGTMLKLQKALDIIRKANQAHHDVHLSFLLSKMTTKVYSKQGPDFGAVSKMIDEMVTVLTNEQAEDAKKKEWCTAELMKAEKEMSTKQEKMDASTATISQIEDEIGGIKDDMKALETSISDLDKAVFEATAARKQAHAEYVESLQLTEAAVGLIGKAKNRLNKFYNPTVYKAAPKKEATMEEKIIASYGSFIQRHVSTKSAKRQLPDIPELPDKKESNSGGVMALMDTIVLDLEKDKATAEADEKTAQKEYVALMSESQTTREADSKSLVNKRSVGAELESSLDGDYLRWQQHHFIT